MGKGSADSSGVAAAQASAQAAMLSYSLGEQQLKWAQDVWNQEQPLVTQSEQAQIAVSQADLKSLEQQQQFAAEQEAMYNQYYAPLEATYTNQVANWASPANTALVTGQARAGVASNVQQGINTAKEQLEGFGVKPDDPRFAGLYIGANTMGAAAEAGAGTTAAQNLKLQQLGLEQGAIQTRRNVAGSTVGMTNAATSAGQGSAGSASGAAGTSQSNLQAGSSAFTAPVNWFNTGATNMGVYTNAVNQYNNAQIGFEQANSGLLGGIGKLAGGIFGMFAEKGGPVDYADGGDVSGDDSRIVSPVKNTNRLTEGIPGRRTLPLRPAQPRVIPPDLIPPGYRFDPNTQGLRDPNLPTPMQPPIPSFMPPGYNTTPGIPRPGNEEWEPQQPSSIAGEPYEATRPPPALYPGQLPPGSAGNPWDRYRSSQAPPVPPVWTSTNMPPPGSEVPVNPQLPVQLRNQMNLAPSTAMAGGGPAQPMPTQGIPTGGTPGGPVPVHASPSMGAATDDVDAKLTAGEFVIPKDVAQWKGHEHFVKQIDKAREEHQQFKGRGDIGGEPAHGIPARPTFVSRPSPISAPLRRYG
jgi:hypothetical protein